MEHDSSYIKRLRKKLTDRAVMKKNKMLEVVKDENNKNI